VLRQTFLTLANSNELKNVATGNSAARKLASRFIAGDTLPQAVSVIRTLNAKGIKATFDHLGENVTTHDEAVAAADSYIDILNAIAEARLDSNVSLKLTQMGMDVDEELCYRNVARICARARETDNFVRVDMESSAYTDRTLDLFRRLWHRDGYRNVGVVLQAYLYRTERDVREMNAEGVRVRLCKGAYNEPEEIAFPRKADVDANFAKLTTILLREGNYPAIATHDSRLISFTQRYAASKGIEPSRFEFQMLNGVRPELHLELVKQGYNMRVYVPYGTEWYSYFMRRMAERPANLVLLSRSLLQRT
jgi:proline dehydrogenase